MFNVTRNSKPKRLVIEEMIIKDTIIELENIINISKDKMLIDKSLDCLKTLNAHKELNLEQCKFLDSIFQ